MRYPYPCTRCGFCCLCFVCVIGQRFYGIFEKGTRCPGLSFHNGIASCALVARNLVPVGDGCCISARAFKDGKEYDFAALPGEVKRELTQMVLEDFLLIERTECENSYPVSEGLG
jgi:hypothetical protein